MEETDRKSLLEKILEKYSAEVLGILEKEAPQSVRKVRFFRRGMQMPEIILLPERTEEEERTLKALDNIFLERYRGSPLYEKYSELKRELSRKLSRGNRGLYSAKRNTLVLAANLGLDELAEVAKKGWTKLLRRGIMQSDRDSGGQYSTFRYARGRSPSPYTDGDSELEAFGGRSIPEVKKFFSLLQPLIDASVEGRLAEKDEAFTLSSLARARWALGGISLEDRAERVVKEYDAFVEKVYEIFTSEGEKEKRYREALSDFLKFAGLYEPAAPLYFQLVLDSPCYVEGFRDSLYNILEGIDFAEMGLMGGIEKAWENIALEGEFIPFIYSVEDDALDPEEISFYIAKLAVNERMEELFRSWPDLFFRDDGVIYGKYILPVYSAVNRMRSDAGRPPLKPSQ